MSLRTLTVMVLACLSAAQPLDSRAVNATVSNQTAFKSTLGFRDPVFLPSKGGKAICVSGIVRVRASAVNDKLDFKVPSGIAEINGAIIDLISAGSTLADRVVTGKQNVSGTYDIYSQLCLPAGGGGRTPSSVQVLTHGLGFDHTYWDFAPGYSTVDIAASAGYATFLYDRLGTGNSSRPDPIQVIQAPLQVAILGELVGMLRRGALAGMPFSKVAGVGHSYGSILTEGLLALHPSATATTTTTTTLDAAVLTGFSTNFTGMPAFVSGVNLDAAATNAPYRFPGLSDAFLAIASPLAMQTGFFKYPGFAHAMPAAAYAASNTIAFGEIFSQFALLRPSSFSGPVMALDGDADLPFCFGNCSDGADKPRVALDTLFPAAANRTTLLLRNTGHAVNLHFSAREAFEEANRFLQANGVPP